LYGAFEKQMLLIFTWANTKLFIAFFNQQNMLPQTKLTIIKVVHTAVWIFFNVVIFYMLYAVIVNKLDIWLWIGYGLFLLEGIILLVFKLYCPLTVMARKYSNSSKANFDIYLPIWLARYTKLIYTSILIVIILITVYQLLK
jgi:hypothetical protein